MYKRQAGVCGRAKITSLLGNILYVRGMAGKNVTVNGVEMGIADDLLTISTNKGDIIEIG